MMKVIDALDKEVKEVDELIICKKRDYRYILSVPHGGTFIPLKFKNKLKIGRSMLKVCDLFSEELYDGGNGILISSKLNTFLPNINRFRNGSNDKSLSLHLQANPLNDFTFNEESILLEEFTLEEKEELLRYYDEYHSLITKSIDEMKEKKGYALMFDCHSTNSRGNSNSPDKGKGRADFIIGTLDGKSCNLHIANKFCRALEKSGFSVSKNFPFNGGAITRMHSNPKKDIHVIQIETKRFNYMHEVIDIKDISLHDFKIKKKGFKKIHDVLRNAIEATSKETERIYNK